jgi:Ca2+-transporting ATPase
MVRAMSDRLPDSAREDFHTPPVGEVLADFGVDPERGLGEDEVAARRQVYGDNQLAGDGGSRPALILVRQFTDLMIVVLVVAALVAGLIGEMLDAVAILVIVLLNGIVGFIQEYRAERALQALQRLSAPHVEALRDGRASRVAEAALVPGDIIRLEAGDVVPADLRLIRSANLMIDEAPLTGESLPVAKDAEAEVAAETAVAERANMAHKGTLVNSGHALCVTVATGAQTELGRIAELMRGRERPLTPLQRRLARFGRRLFAAVLVICAIIFTSGLLRGEPALLMLLTAVSLAVAAIPEALPAVVTVGLALGAKRIAQRNALVRRLPAVETLGSVTVICCDKTGTLTQNAMRVERFLLPGEELTRLPSTETAAESQRALGRAMALNNDAEAGAESAARGDPTEVALLEAAQEAGFSRDGLQQDWPRVSEIPFEAERRRMTTLHAGPAGALAVVKGAPEAVLPLCRDQLSGDGAGPLDRAAVIEAAEAAAAEGYRLLAFAERRLDSPPEQPGAEEVERELTFLGLVALADPPRPRVKEALESCETAGITVAMITGDHPATAKAVAARLGMAVDDDAVMTGDELRDLTPEQRSEAVLTTRIYARVSPEQKYDIVTALQDHREFTAMTGDGVNDAPALKQADIGVAMGRKGTDVAREAADAVLLDDDFATIVAAVREGRRIYDNIRKFIKYTMTSNSGEIWTIFLAPFLGLPLPLLPIQILWINLVTDGLPGLALAVEPEERDIMKRPPRPPGESVFARGMWQHMIWVGLLIGGLALGAQAWAYNRGSENWQTVAFTVLTLSQLVHAMAIRSDRDSLFTVGWLSNPSLFGAVVLTLGLQMAVVYLDPLQAVFKTNDLALEELAVSLGLPCVVLVAVEAEKWLMRRGMIYRDSGPPDPLAPRGGDARHAGNGRRDASP